MHTQHADDHGPWYTGPAKMACTCSLVKTELNDFVPASGPPAALEGVLQDELRHLRRLAAPSLTAHYNYLGCN